MLQFIFAEVRRRYCRRCNDDLYQHHAVCHAAHAGDRPGAQPISSYNYGAGNAGRVKETFLLLLKVCMTYSIVLWLAIMLFPRMFAGIFSGDPALLDYSVKALRIYCAAMFLFGIQIACQLTFTSIGNAVCSIIVAVVRKFVLLIPLIYIVPALHILPDKAHCVYLAETIADVIAVTFTSILFYIQFRKALKKLSTDEVKLNETI